MIQTKSDLRRYLKADARANGRSTLRPRLIGDMTWKFQLALRNLEYCINQKGWRKWLVMPRRVFYYLRYMNLSIRLGFTITANVFDEGLSIAHRGTIIVSNHARIGKNCRIHEGVTIGGSNGSFDAAKIGDNVFIASGAKIIGDVTIADDVAIAANAVVVKSITEPGTTWGGIPAKKISNSDSHANLNPNLFS